jgi:hypothetical protein
LKGIVFDNFTFSRHAAFYYIRNAAGASPFGYPIRLKTIRSLKIRPPPPLFLGRLTRSLLLSLLSCSTALYFFSHWLLLPLLAGLTLRIALPRNAPESGGGGLSVVPQPASRLASTSAYFVHRLLFGVGATGRAMFSPSPLPPNPPLSPSPFALVAI